MLAAPNMTFWPRLSRALGLGALVDDPDLQTIEGQIANAARVTAAFETAFGAGTLRELRPRLDAEDLIWSAVTPIREAVKDRQARLNDMIASVPTGDGEFRTMNIPVRFSDSRVEVRGPAPEIGQHTEEVLLEAGLGWEDIAALRERGAIG
jgi:formyl-CoA transferase